MLFKNMKKLVVLVTVFCMLFAVPVMAEAQNITVYKNAIQLRLNGSYIALDTYLTQNQVYVPLRGVAESFGYEVVWNEADRSINLKTDAQKEASFESVEYQTGTTPATEELEVYSNELSIAVDSVAQNIPHFLYQGTTYIQASSFYQLTKCHVYLDQTTMSVRIYHPDYIAFAENEAAAYNGVKLTEDKFNDIAKYVYSGNLEAGQQRAFADVESYLLYNAATFGLAKKYQLDDSGFEEFCVNNDADALMEQLAISDKEFFKETIVKDFYYREILSGEKGKELYVPKDEDMIMAFIQSPYSQGHWMKAKHILIEKGENDEGLKTAKDLLSKLKKNPKDFDKLMDEYSADPGSKAQPEGYLFKEGDMVTEFYEGTLPLKADEISDIVESAYGYHIIKKVADYPEGVPFMELAEELHTSYAQNAFLAELVSEMANTDTVLNSVILER